MIYNGKVENDTELMIEVLRDLGTPWVIPKQLTKVWNTVDRIINKQHNNIKLHPSDLNTHFTTLVSCLTHKDNEPHDVTDSFNTISEETELETFKIKHTNYNGVRKIILGIKKDCSTGDDDPYSLYKNQ